MCDEMLSMSKFNWKVRALLLGFPLTITFPAKPIKNRSNGLLRGEGFEFRSAYAVERRNVNGILKNEIR